MEGSSGSVVGFQRSNTRANLVENGRPRKYFKGVASCCCSKAIKCSGLESSGSTGGGIRPWKQLDFWMDIMARLTPIFLSERLEG